MKNEYLHEDTESKQQSVEGQNIVDEDLKFIRSVIEKTYRAFDPGSWIYIVWGLIWYILLLNGTVWSAMALQGGYFDELVCFSELDFLWTVIFGFGLSIMGILSSKEWLFGGIAIFIAILAASFIKEHAYVILGIVMGLACIVPAIIAKRNYRKQEKENAKT
jgi:hypothetical protein